MKGLLLALVFTVSTAWAQDCLQVEGQNLCIKIEWIEGPNLGAMSSNVVKFVDLDQSTGTQEVYSTPKGTLEFYGWMIMGRHAHGTRPVETRKVQNGVFENKKIFFMDGMKGRWQFNLKIDGVIYTLFEMNV